MMYISFKPPYVVVVVLFQFQFIHWSKNINFYVNKRFSLPIEFCLWLLWARKTKRIKKSKGRSNKQRSQRIYENQINRGLRGYMKILFFSSSQRKFIPFQRHSLNHYLPPFSFYFIYVLLSRPLLLLHPTRNPSIRVVMCRGLNFPARLNLFSVDNAVGSSACHSLVDAPATRSSVPSQPCHLIAVRCSQLV